MKKFFGGSNIDKLVHSIRTQTSICRRYEEARLMHETGNSWNDVTSILSQVRNAQDQRLRMIGGKSQKSHDSSHKKGILSQTISGAENIDKVNKAQLHYHLIKANPEKAYKLELEALQQLAALREELRDAVASEIADSQIFQDYTTYQQDIQMRFELFWNYQMSNNPPFWYTQATQQETINHAQAYQKQLQQKQAQQIQTKQAQQKQEKMHGEPTMTPEQLAEQKALLDLYKQQNQKQQKQEQQIQKKQAQQTQKKMHDDPQTTPEHRATQKALLDFYKQQKQLKQKQAQQIQKKQTQQTQEKMHGDPQMTPEQLAEQKALLDFYEQQSQEQQIQEQIKNLALIEQENKQTEQIQLNYLHDQQNVLQSQGFQQFAPQYYPPNTLYDPRIHGQYNYSHPQHYAPEQSIFQTSQNTQQTSAQQQNVLNFGVQNQQQVQQLQFTSPTLQTYRGSQHTPATQEQNTLQTSQQSSQHTSAQQQNAVQMSQGLQQNSLNFLGQQQQIQQMQCSRPALQSSDNSPNIFFTEPNNSQQQLDISGSHQHLGWAHTDVAALPVTQSMEMFASQVSTYLQNQEEARNKEEDKEQQQELEHNNDQTPRDTE